MAILAPAVMVPYAGSTTSVTTSAVDALTDLLRVIGMVNCLAAMERIASIRTLHAEMAQNAKTEVIFWLSPK